MPVILTEKPAPYETIPNRIRWTRRQCDAMRDVGFLSGRYELVDGEIISKMGQKPPHAYVIRAILTWLASLFGTEYIQIQATIDLSEISPDYDEPEPDAAVTAQPYTHYADRHPGPKDVLLLIEVSDTTLRFDLNTKADLYARAEIREYWIIDILGRQVFVHRQPSPEGYGEVMVYSAVEEVATIVHPDAPVRISDLLPPA
jgi:Uma2 family endonuclease